MEDNEKIINFLSIMELYDKEIYDFFTDKVEEDENIDISVIDDND